MINKIHEPKTLMESDFTKRGFTLTFPVLLPKVPAVFSCFKKNQPLSFINFCGVRIFMYEIKEKMTNDCTFNDFDLSTTNTTMINESIIPALGRLCFYLVSGLCFLSHTLFNTWESATSLKGLFFF